MHNGAASVLHPVPVRGLKWIVLRFGTYDVRWRTCLIAMRPGGFPVLSDALRDLIFLRPAAVVTITWPFSFSALRQWLPR